jgi:hypothetical protein
MKLEFYKQLDKFKFNFKHNLSFEEFKCFLYFVKEKPFKIVELDKNVGVGIISHTLYNKLCLEHLSKDDNYISLPSDPISSSFSDINNILHFLHIEKHISLKLYKSLKLDLSSCKTGSFRALPKIHKSKFSIRPIINCVGHLTSNLCYLIDIILKPFVIYSASYLKDSQQLLQEAENLVIPPSSNYIVVILTLYTLISI